MTRILPILAALCLLPSPLAHAAGGLAPVPKLVDAKTKAKMAKDKAKKQKDAEKRFKICAAKLRNAGYDVTEQDIANPRGPLLARFAANGNADAVKIWIECGVPVDRYADATNHRTCRSALTLAIENGHDKIARMLIKAGAPLYGATMPINPLEAAAKTGNIPMAQALVNAGADVNTANSCPFGAPDSRKCTPLMLASGNPEMAAYLISAGADIHATDSSGRVALFYAIPRKSPECVLLYLEKGLDINAQDNRGKTPLHHAAELNDDEMVQFLLDNGAKHDIKNAAGLNVYEAAKLAKAFKVVALLEKILPSS